MKKLSFVAVIAALLFPVALVAQEEDNPAGISAVESLNDESEDAEAPEKEKKAPEYGLANHLGVGVGVGIDGLTLSAGVPLGSHFAVRAGYNFMSMVYPYKTTLDLGEVEMSKDGGAEEKWDLSIIPIEASLAMQYFGMVDFYPCKNGCFRITAGVFAGNADIATISADLTNVDKLTPEDYAKTSFEYNGFAISTDKKGFVHAGIRAKSKVIPYFGIGFGRICNIKSRVSFSFDLGLIKTSGIEVYARNYKDKVDAVLTSETVEHEDTFDFTGVPFMDKYGEQTDLIDKAAKGELPLVKDFLPFVKLGINIRIF